MKKAKMLVHNGTHSQQPSEAPKLLQLPPLAVESMTQTQLRSVIPQLMSLVSSQKDLMSNKDQKPLWWPPDIPWTATRTDIRQQEASLTETLREVVRSCYRHFGQEIKLQNSHKPRRESPFSPNNTFSKRSPISSPKPVYSEIYVCYFCEKEFTDKEEMIDHQAKCKDRPPVLHEIPLTPPRHQSEIMDKPPKMSPVKLNLNHSFSRTTKDMFVKYLYLLPKQKAEKIRARTRRSIDVECEELDVSEPETPISPTTPRTPKSLISQLSREDSTSVSKKRLSYSDSIDNDDKESVISGCSEDSEDRPSNKGKSLLSIDISSLLGQRIQKHVKSESAIRVVEDSENFCRTPIKNQFYEKLRNRSTSYPISYKPRKKTDTRYTHMYCFTSRQRRERKARLGTGLNHHGRELLKSIKPCKVVLARLTNKELKRFMGKSAYSKHIKQQKQMKADSVFPQDPIMLTADVDRLLGLKKRSDMADQANFSPMKSLAAVVSEDASADVSKQKLTLYKCLLNDLALTKNYVPKTEVKLEKQLQVSKRNSRVGSRPSLVTENSLSLSPNQCSTPRLPLSPVSPPESLSDHAVPYRARMSSPDDNISIISIESDEESIKSGCCTACRNKKHCRCTPTESRMSSPDLRLVRAGPGSSQSRSSLPVNVPLRISPGSSSSGSPQVSPCGSWSSTRASLDLIQQSLPSPASSVHSRTSSTSPDLVEKSASKGTVNRDSPMLFKAPADLTLSGRNEVKTVKQNKQVLSPTSQNKNNLIEGKQNCKVTLNRSESEKTEACSDARAQRVLRRRSALENVDTDNQLQPSRRGSIQSAPQNPSTTNVIPKNSSPEKKKIPVKPIVTLDSKDKLLDGSLLFDSEKRMSSRENSPRIATRKLLTHQKNQGSPRRLSCNREDSDVKRKGSPSCKSCIACNTMLLDKSISPRNSPHSSPCKPGVIANNKAVISDIQTRRRSGSTSSPFKPVGNDGITASPLKKSASDTENKTTTEPSRRSKRLLSGSLNDGGSPYKMRRMETV